MEIEEKRGGKWGAFIACIVALPVGGFAGSVLTAKTGRAPFGVGNAVPLWIAAATPCTWLCNRA